MSCNGNPFSAANNYGYGFGQQQCCNGGGGARGASGATGARGPPGAPGAGAIIPFASGVFGTMSSLVSGLVSTGTLVGFGTNMPSVSLLGGTIDLAPLLPVIVNEAFVVPRASTITSLAASFTVTAGVALLPTQTATVHAQLYLAPAGSVVFSPIPTAFVNLGPGFNNVLNIAPGNTVSGINSVINVPVVAGDKLLLVFSVTSSPGLLIGALSGIMSAGVAMS